jgi:hypothetical protein
MEKFDGMIGLDEAFEPTPEEREGVRLENDGLTHRDDHDGLSDEPDMPPVGGVIEEEETFPQPLSRDDHDGMSDEPDDLHRRTAA